MSAPTQTELNRGDYGPADPRPQVKCSVPDCRSLLDARLVRCEECKILVCLDHANEAFYDRGRGTGYVVCLRCAAQNHGDDAQEFLESARTYCGKQEVEAAQLILSFLAAGLRNSDYCALVILNQKLATETDRTKDIAYRIWAGKDYSDATAAELSAAIDFLEVELEYQKARGRSVYQAQLILRMAAGNFPGATLQSILEVK